MAGQPNEALSVRRREELKKLPQSHESFLKSNNRHLIRDTHLSGKLLPDRNHPAAGRNFERGEVTYYALPDNVICTDKQVADMCIVALSSLYLDPDIVDLNDPDLDNTLVCPLTILAVFARSNDLSANGIIRAGNEYGMRIVREEITEEALVQMADEAWPALADAMQLAERHESTSSLIVVALSTLLLIAKRLIAASIMPWFRARWSSIAGVLARKITPTGINTPNLVVCNSLNNAVASRHQLRAGIFRTMRALGAMQAGKYRNVFAMLVKQMQYTEMNHIYLIINHVYVNNPDILAFTEFVGPEQSAMALAFKVLGEKPAEDRPYIKLLYDEPQLEALHAKNFRLYTVAARAIAQMTDPSMGNFVVKENPQLQAFAAKVTAHMVAKSQVSALNAAEAIAPMLNTAAGKMLLSSGHEAPREDPGFEDAADVART
ncbi:putative nucleocapsid protein [Anisopteromalus calandrae negative-strand RNA virus 2]|uniref:Nucleocapsid protein n=1 Tax=Anisopteromalus calandrae negative-strand RNA virus 2 TaxID=2848910 RepID=A0AAE7RYF9_9MONO|nr:putative nucleocapsid protein [Anisopteromalus calandrae negative-strand RNA virus 2]QWT43286.1 putative nucleocapsid protein [Anisopteromalus calandrae negative-strand RNA virus 2]